MPVTSGSWAAGLVVVVVVVLGLTVVVGTDVGPTVVGVTVVGVTVVVEGVGKILDDSAPRLTSVTWTTVGRSARPRVTLTPPTTTRAASTVQRTRRIDVCLMPGLTRSAAGSLRCNLVTAAVEGFRARLRPTSDVGIALQLRLPGFLAAAVPRPAEVGEPVVARARQGDQEAFAQIVGHYDHRLRALAFRLLGDRDRMDDVLQEAYVKAFRALPRFKGDSALGTWLYRIAYNACIDDLRRRPTADPLRLDDDRAGSLVDPTSGPAEIAVQRCDLAAAMDRLPPDQRAAVLLVDAYGMDYADAGAVLGVRAGTIGSRLSRARTVLRAALDPGGDE